MCEGTNILEFLTHIVVAYFLFWESGFDRIIVKITLFYGILKIKKFYFSSISKTFQKSKGQLISKREQIF